MASSDQIGVATPVTPATPPPAQGQLNHQIRAEEREAATLLGAEHGVIGQVEAVGTVELLRGEPQMPGHS